jgi:hypothetical protein
VIGHIGHRSKARNSVRIAHLCMVEVNRSQTMNRFLSQARKRPRRVVEGEGANPMASQPPTPEIPTEVPADVPIPTPTDPVPPVPTDPVTNDTPAPAGDPFIEGP